MITNVLPPFLWFTVYGGGELCTSSSIIKAIPRNCQGSSSGDDWLYDWLIIHQYSTDIAVAQTLHVSTTTLKQFQSGLKTILFHLAYGT